MKSTLLLFVVTFVAVGATSCTGVSESERRARGASTESTQRASAPRQAEQQRSAAAVPHAGTDPHSHGVITPGRVPAFQADAASLKNLPPVMSPALFTGTTRTAYEMVSEIPEVIAQLPCYCHCDQGHGHKSLHSCFVDEHGAQCGVCLSEAMAAYRMSKQQGLKPEQIRERIIAQYGKS